MGPYKWKPIALCTAMPCAFTECSGVKVAFNRRCSITISLHMAANTASILVTLTPALSPRGILTLAADADAPAIDPGTASRLAAAFGRGAGHGLLHLAGSEITAALPPALVYWREFASRYVAALCQLPPHDSTASVDSEPPTIPTPTEGELQTLVLAAPAMPGAEYISAEILDSLWRNIGDAFAQQMEQSGLSREATLKQLDPAWNVVGRVHFNLAENHKDTDAPFAFLATYTHQLSARGKPQHLPLGEALHEFAGTRNRQRLLSLLLPVQRAADSSDWLREMVTSKEIFHPVRWTPAQAYQLLADVPVLERSGVIVRMPAGWGAPRPPRAAVSVTVGARAPSGVGADALMDFNMDITLGGEKLTRTEVKELLSGARRLAFIRGRWVEIDADQLKQTLSLFEDAQRAARENGLTFSQAVRLLAGGGVSPGDQISPVVAEWSRVSAGPWLTQMLGDLRSPEGLARVDAGRELKGVLRPYQSVGVRWLHLLSTLGLGACLADDMGLGKTIQLLSLLLVRRKENARRKTPHHPTLLVAPASILANWGAEIDRFAPSLNTIIAHPSAMTSTDLRAIDATRLDDVDLVITTYGTVLRQPWMTATPWDLVVLDEAQAIKNPAAKQTRAVKMLTSQARIALTGTPVENHLSDLWSLFDFINPGLLGSAPQFARFTKAMAKRTTNPYGPLRELVRPYILRRLKTDRTVIADLPDKTELRAYCNLTKLQAAMYKEEVDALAERLKAVDGIRRRGVVLAALVRLKQICNHPDHGVGEGGWDPTESGKFARLRELVDVIAAKQEKVLVFTQFREVIPPLADFLRQLFGREGVTLSGETAIAKRATLVRRFQDDDTVPFFVISLKAGGSGLNLTAASHVIHFDRWWNPAVENQATDRAFRIGQTKNVLVHKYICRGTVEEKIDTLIESKRGISAELLGGGSDEVQLTEMSDAELMRLVSLDIRTALEEGT